MTEPVATPLTCPSAQPDMKDAAPFGILSGTRDAPALLYMKRDAAVDPPTFDSLGDLDPTLVFRFSGRCEEGLCAQFVDGRCGLATRIVERLKPVVAAPPPCRIRDSCRWHAEAGVAACLRCPQIATRVPETRADLVDVARPRAVVA